MTPIRQSAHAFSERSLWEAYTLAATRWMESPTEDNARAMVEAFQAFAAVYLPDPMQAHEAVEDLRRNMQGRRAA